MYSVLAYRLFSPFLRGLTYSIYTSSESDSKLSEIWLVFIDWLVSEDVLDGDFLKGLPEIANLALKYNILFELFID